MFSVGASNYHLTVKRSSPLYKGTTLRSQFSTLGPLDPANMHFGSSGVIWRHFLRNLEIVSCDTGARIPQIWVNRLWSQFPLCALMGWSRYVSTRHFWALVSGKDCGDMCFFCNGIFEFTIWRNLEILLWNSTKGWNKGVQVCWLVRIFRSCAFSEFSAMTKNIFLPSGSKNSSMFLSVLYILLRYRGQRITMKNKQSTKLPQLRMEHLWLSLRQDILGIHELVSTCISAGTKYST